MSKKGLEHLASRFTEAIEDLEAPLGCACQAHPVPLSSSDTVPAADCCLIRTSIWAPL